MPEGKTEKFISNMKTMTQNEAQVANTDRPATVQYVAPDVNIYETKDGYELEAEMPGVSKEGLEITVEGQQISIVGRRADEVVPGEVLFRERSHAAYRRVFDLDPAIDTTRIAARMQQGVLHLALPKSEAVKPRKIAVSE
jgi:HSP20 family protein